MNKPMTGATRERSSILAINGGSSSIRFSLYDSGDSLHRLLHGKMDRVGMSGTNLTFQEAGKPSTSLTIADDDSRSPVVFLLGIELIEEMGRRHPGSLQVACFDTAFHRNMPRVARLLPIPCRYEAAGVQRYGFHGLSYEYLMEELTRLGDPAATSGRVILAHLGNGASLAAVRKGQSIDTSMGFTPAAGLVMGTRSGDLDPGLMAFLARNEDMSVSQFQRMVNYDSGMLGVSDISSDLRDLLALEADNVRAAEAVALFCYQAKKWIGSFAAVLGGLDTLVFAGGIGENAPVIRARICEGLEFLGIELNREGNAENGPLISTTDGRVKVRVIRTDEELMIARSVHRVLGSGTKVD